MGSRPGAKARTRTYRTRNRASKASTEPDSASAEPDSRVGRALEQDLERELGCAALDEQLGGPVQVDVGAGSKLDCGQLRVAGPFELFRTPLLNELLLGEAEGCLGGRHLVVHLLGHLFGTTSGVVLPILGDIRI